MKYTPGFVLMVLCLALVLAAGCTNQTEPVKPPRITETPVPATVITPVPDTPILLITPETAAPVVATPAPGADPADVNKIKFLRYSDNDFSVDYPSTWLITNSTYTPDYCPRAFGYGKAECYAHAIKSIGPFDFYRDDTPFEDTARIVIFTSPDGRLRFVSFTQDFQDQQSGNFRIDPTIDWINNEFQKMYPDLFPTNYVGNYQYSRSGNTMASTYDARLPEGYYPGAYSKKVVVTVHHLSSFAFITDTDDAGKYRDLNQWMMSSLETKDIA